MCPIAKDSIWQRIYCCDTGFRRGNKTLENKGASTRLLKSTLVVLITLFFFSADLGDLVHGTSEITGQVVDSNGIPLEGAIVYLYSDRVLLDKVSSDEAGRFSFDVEGIAFTLYALFDDENTPGYDYVPSRAEVDSQSTDVEMVLLSGSTVRIEGNIQYVESEDLPTTFVYFVIDPESKEVLDVDGFPLIYGSEFDTQSQFLGLDEDLIILPTESHVHIRVNSSVLVESNLVTKSFDIDNLLLQGLQKGELLSLDIRQFSIPENFDIVRTYLDQLKVQLDEMDDLGFYLASERKVLSTTSIFMADAEYLFENGSFEKSYDNAKKAFIDVSQTILNLEAMITDASVSVYIIIFFLGLTSTTVAFLLSNRDTTKAQLSIVGYGLTLTALYFIYPGSSVVPFEKFIGSGILALSLSLIVAMVFPKFMKAKGGDSHLPVRNILVPIFSMAKRSILRRKLRFALTLMSLMFLVVSFVSLTSFSEGYGLIVNRFSGKPTDDLVLVRASGFTLEEPISISPHEVTIDWLESQPESTVVSPKVENVPLVRPFFKLEDTPMMGVMGIDSKNEPVLIPIKEIIIEGSLPSENGVILTDILAASLGLEIGSQIMINGESFGLDGIVDYKAIARFSEIDGTSYLPKKLVNVNPEGEVPNYVVSQCNPDEYAILHISQALKLPLVGITRIAIGINEDESSNLFGERLALERGYLTWSGSQDGVYFARLGEYFEGKGIPLLVPWVIVILNVVITMLNSMYERRSEIHILSSVGLNPAQIAAIFIAEATIIGLTAGGIGYLIGLSIYKGMVALQITLEIHQKISAVWSLASVGISMVAVLMGAFAALQSSIVITPSLMRRWRIEQRKFSYSEPFEISIPVRLLSEEVPDFIDFTVNALNETRRDPVRSASTPKVKEIPKQNQVHVDFNYRAPESVASNFYTKNTLIVDEGGDNVEVVVKLISYGERDWVHITGSLVRMIAMRWSASQERIDLYDSSDA
jgi:ABC-type lipoprotein release transport system permease subunit